MSFLLTLLNEIWHCLDAVFIHVQTDKVAKIQTPPLALRRCETLDSYRGFSGSQSLKNSSSILRVQEWNNPRYPHFRQVVKVNPHCLRASGALRACNHAVNPSQIVG